MQRALWAIVASVCLGCGGDPTGPAATDTYILKTINDVELPYVVSEDVNARKDVVSGRITLYEDGSFADFTTFRTTHRNGSADQEVRLRGAFARAGTTITFMLPDTDGNPNNDQYTGEVVGDGLIVSATTVVWYYER